MDEIKFKLERATKNTVRYQEVIPEGKSAVAVIGTIYIQKWYLGNTPPQEITVTIKK